MSTYGLIGVRLDYSFSQRYFTEKFSQLGIRDRYELFEIPQIDHFPVILKRHPDLNGINVTIPYKTAVVPFLDELSEAAQQIGAVNTIQLLEGKLIGHNTDVIGFRDALRDLSVGKKLKKALILGTGGASKAAVYALNTFFDCDAQLVSRRERSGVITYERLPDLDWSSVDLVVNTTPLGTYPDIDQCPDLPYDRFTSDHIAFDMVYNPAETLFMRKAQASGARASNGYEMLVGQAEAAWQIWQGEL